MAKPICIGLLLLFTGIALPAHAQATNRSAAAVVATPVLGTKDAKAATDSNATRNVYAENLQPKIKRPAHLRNLPYNPIKKQDDLGQIPEIEMFVGESRVFPTPGVARIAVGNGQIMTAAALDAKEVIVFANAAGTSSLFVWNEDGRYQRIKVNIVPGDTSRIAREVAAFLTTIPHTKASIVGDKVIVEGDNLSDADLAKIEYLEKRYPQIVNFTNRIGWEQMVMMDVKVVEFPKSELRDIGLKWAAVGGFAIGGIWQPIRGGVNGPYGTNIITGTNNPPPIVNPDGTRNGVPLPSPLNIRSAMNLGLSAQLNLLAQDGKASILAEPQLSARNGSKASFLAGGEFPYSVSTVNGVTIIFKPYGIKLDILPRVDRNGVVRATIESEVSKIDPSVTTLSGPALLTRKTNTEFNVRSGETIVLSGLLQVDSSTNIDKVPLLGDVPVLGALFRSKRFQNQETELVVFVTPTVVDSRSPALVDRIERATERLQQNLERAQPYLSNPLQPGHDASRFNTMPPYKRAPAGQIFAVSSARAPLATTSVPVTEAAPALAAQPAAMHSATSVPLTPATQNSLSQLQPASAGGSTLRVKKDGLIIRARPATESAALLQLGYGSVVQLGSADPEPRGHTYWRNVVVGEINGWVMADGVDPSRMQPAIKPYADSAAARQDQGSNALVLGPNAKGRSASGGTRAVTALDPINAADRAARPLEQYRVVLERTALRVTPDINAAVVQNLSEGQVVEALPQPPRGHWIAVQVDGKRGWAASQWLNPVASQN